MSSKCLQIIDHSRQFEKEDQNVNMREHINEHEAEFEEPMFQTKKKEIDNINQAR